VPCVNFASARNTFAGIGAGWCPAIRDHATTATEQEHPGRRGLVPPGARLCGCIACLAARIFPSPSRAVAAATEPFPAETCSVSRRADINLGGFFPGRPVRSQQRALAPNTLTFRFDRLRAAGLVTCVGMAVQ
jgi:hypothetical protein